ncbi:MAG: hypothetical protein QME90_04395 [Thermodesulfobacteriota bacterium]|nr:hypothetical protein [Thermodesulfobacteriota bacterium]
MVLQSVFYMEARQISDHSQIMPEIAPLRQVSPGSLRKDVIHSQA